MYFVDGSFYNGYLFMGMPDGEGRLINEYGACYQGEIKTGKAEGKVTLHNLLKKYSY